MLAFHNDQAIKDKYINRVKAHAAADNIIRGTGWEGGKGCAVGCTLEAYDHSRYETELGIPEWLARVEDTLFEGMSVEKSRSWPEVFLASITPGANLEAVKPKFMICVLKSCLENFDHEKFPEVKNAVDGSIALWSRDDIDSAAWSAAESAARSAAESAAESAARSAAKYAARSAAESAAKYAAKYAAWSAAESAARHAKFDYFADELVKMLKDAV